MNAQPLIDHFESFLPLSDTERQLIESRVARRIVRRKEEILRAGHLCRHYSFVAEGCLKMYVVDTKGVNYNIQFAAEGDWIADIGGFHSGKPSQAFIEAVEPSIVFTIEKEDLYHLYRSISKLDRIFKVIIENKFVELQNRVLQNISSTAHERYRSFVEQYPKLVQRLPNTQIASYLGITPEFLSKVRKDLSRH
ncbi:MULTISPECIES: Crp/Fnr family transcriptional regulator [unclassified Imperialibacter]|uniref:Crp/Fnr family transcriptional regulator n=1 Tax=unclassified Imperialibacter TaxID=2629706 RepID=UPI0012517579|nr:MULTISPECIES: Crp/Fnr family transcriptional regulator [unclassified Imperialibacter]CAD5256187.1 Cyclic nucleotide-binding protein [Imperialibacter sp. 89]CAD5262284.1 Cyclic nucleotide-binding protein [Imperialibacter sp. 75]VVT33148.1 Cyclic nucleotide-binding protein [Imperialibacter sp. EC-SDR9]